MANLHLGCGVIIHLGAFCIENAPTLFVATGLCPVATRLARDAIDLRLVAIGSVQVAARSHPVSN